MHLPDRLVLARQPLVRREVLGHEVVRRLDAEALAVQVARDLRQRPAAVGVELVERHMKAAVELARLVPRREKARHAIDQSAVDVEEGRRRRRASPRAHVAHSLFWDWILRGYYRETVLNSSAAGRLKLDHHESPCGQS